MTLLVEAQQVRVLSNVYILIKNPFKMYHISTTVFNVDNNPNHHIRMICEGIL